MIYVLCQKKLNKRAPCWLKINSEWFPDFSKSIQMFGAVINIQTIQMVQ